MHDDLCFVELWRDPLISSAPICTDTMCADCNPALRCPLNSNAPIRTDGIPKLCMKNIGTLMCTDCQPAKPVTRDTMPEKYNYERARMEIDRNLHDFKPENAVKRGLTVGFLVEFCRKFDLWKTPTWQVRRDYIIPMTKNDRCRFVDLLAVKESDVVGVAEIFISFSNATLFGDLITAIRDAADDQCRVWIDIFAVMQWPSLKSDLNFDQTGHCQRSSNGSYSFTVNRKMLADLNDYIDINKADATIDADKIWIFRQINTGYSDNDGVKKLNKLVNDVVKTAKILDSDPILEAAFVSGETIALNFIRNKPEFATEIQISIFNRLEDRVEVYRIDYNGSSLNYVLFLEKFQTKNCCMKEGSFLIARILGDDAVDVGVFVAGLCFPSDAHLFTEDGIASFKPDWGKCCPNLKPGPSVHIWFARRLHDRKRHSLSVGCAAPVASREMRTSALRSASSVSHLITGKCCPNLKPNPSVHFAVGRPVGRLNHVIYEINSLNPTLSRPFAMCVIVDRPVLAARPLRQP
eukprot:gene18841-19158_t